MRVFNAYKTSCEDASSLALAGAKEQDTHASIVSTHNLPDDRWTEMTVGLPLQQVTHTDTYAGCDTIRAVAAAAAAATACTCASTIGV